MPHPLSHNLAPPQPPPSPSTTPFITLSPLSNHLLQQRLQEANDRLCQSPIMILLPGDPLLTPTPLSSPYSSPPPCLHPLLTPTPLSAPPCLHPFHFTPFTSPSCLHSPVLENLAYQQFLDHIPPPPTLPYLTPLSPHLPTPTSAYVCCQKTCIRSGTPHDLLPRRTRHCPAPQLQDHPQTLLAHPHHTGNEGSPG